MNGRWVECVHWLIMKLLSTYETRFSTAQVNYLVISAIQPYTFDSSKRFLTVIWQWLSRGDEECAESERPQWQGRHVLLTFFGFSEPTCPTSSYLRCSRLTCLLLKRFRMSGSNVFLFQSRCTLVLCNVKFLVFGWRK